MSSSSPVVLRAALATLAAIVGGASAAAAEVHSFSGVSGEVFACIVATSAAEHGTRYEPAGATTGTAVTETSLYSVTMAFSLDPATQQLDYTLVSKSWVVPESAIWPGVADTVDHCR